MRRQLGGLWLCCLPLVLACNQAVSPTAESESPSHTGGVAVIDLDEVARQLGREGAIKQAITAREANYNQQLETMRVSYTNMVQQRKQELPPEPDPNDLAQLQVFEQKAVAQIQQARQKAQQDLVNQKRDLITAFRAEVKPIATQVAVARGLSVVVSKNESFLFAFDDGVDITEDVVAQMRNSGAAQTSTPANPPTAPVSAEPRLPSTMNSAPAGSDVPPQTFTPPANSSPAVRP